MNDHSIQMRIQFLGIDRFKVRNRLASRQKAHAPEDEIRSLEDELLVISGRISECQDWLKVQSANPLYGEAVWVNGKKVPKLPVFKSAEEREQALSGLNPGIFLKLTPEKRFAAREWRSQINADSAIKMMDGNSPLERVEDGSVSDEPKVADGVSPQAPSDVQEHPSGGEPGEGQPAGDGPAGGEPDGSQPAGG